MALTSVGLTTQIYNNHLKSALLLMGFPVLLLLMLGSFFGALGVLAQPALGDRPVNWDMALKAAADGMVNYGYWAIIVAAVWFTIAYFFQGHIIRAATGA